MHVLRESRFSNTAERLPSLGAGISIGVGLSVLLGWQLRIAALKSILPGLVAMNPATAVAFVLSGFSLIALRHCADRKPARNIGYALATAVTLIGLAKLCDVLLGSHLELDQYLFRARLSASGGLPPNRMAPNTALHFTLLGLALLTLRHQFRTGHRPSQFIALWPAGLSLLAILGYVLDVQQLYGVGSFIPMALNTALTFSVLSVVILFAYPDSGITRVLVADDAGGAMARRMIPFAILIPALLAWVRAHAQRAGLFEVEPGVSVMVFLSIVLLTGLIWHSATRLGRADAERRDALQQLKRANDDLEQHVQQRTAELESSNQRLHSEVEEHSRTEVSLRDSEARYRLLFLGNPHPMWAYECETLRFLAVNQAAIRLYGYSETEFLGMTIADIRPRNDVPQLLEHLTTNNPDTDAPREWRHVRKDGSVIDVEISSHTLEFDGQAAVLVLATNVTGKKQLETQLRQSQKMEAIGLLAGGVAHDFNNLLTAIMGYSQLARNRLGSDAAVRSDLDEILKASERAASLTRQLLAFSRQQVLEPRVLDLNVVVTDLDKMLRRLISEDIDLLSAPAADLGRVMADPGQIEQVLMNLVVNARDAMPRGGKLTIETANVELDEGYTQARLDLKPGRYVMLAVSDTGCGMSPEVVGRVFEPFFTTKELGKGTGLGLSTVHGIVKQSEGHIEIYSEPGQGTTFKIYLPQVEGAVELTHSQRPETDAEPSKGSETVLLVEDEEVIRRVVRQSLELQGYRVIEAGDGSEAIAHCERLDQPIDVLITDVVMPMISGPELAQRVAAIRPDLRVLFISGYTDRALIHQGLRGAGAAFLQKPFTPEALVRKVRDVLDTPRLRAA